jgi:hypothetical protein
MEEFRHLKHLTAAAGFAVAEDINREEGPIDVRLEIDSEDSTISWPSESTKLP